MTQLTEQEKKIIENYNNNISIEELKKQNNCDFYYLRQIFEKVNIYKKTEISEDERIEIINCYFNGMSVHKMKKTFHRSDDRIKQVLVDANIYLGINYPKNNTFKYEDFFNISEEYSKGTSLQKLSEKYHLHKNVIKAILKKMNIPIRNNYEQLQYSNRIYHVNENYFNENNSNMYYIVGFIAADGTIAKYSNSIDIQLAGKDVEILKKIAKEMNFTGQVKEFTNSFNREMCRLTITSKNLVESLLKFNITKNKTLTYQMPNIPDEFLWDYLRGYFDGDGHVSKKGNETSIVTASKDFFDSLKKIYDKYNIEYNIYVDKRKPNLIYDIRTTKKKETKKIYDLLYSNIENKIFMERKYLRFKNSF